ncbi:Yip1 family protein [Chengkuizengella sp. SCS-71B]|uniref:Yip1 family protein n=1 Tax=Chengkuizengella sp. SCS-71B TaxID=3115290 RepID=UPI0032C2129B
MEAQNNETHEKNININDFKKDIVINPWFSIWLKPRQTMRYVLNNKPSRIFLFLLIFLGTFKSFDLDIGTSYLILNSIDQINSSVNLSSILFTSIIGSLILAVGAYYIYPILLRWFGSLLGGKGTTQEVRNAYAYSLIPQVYLLIFVAIPSLLLFGIENYTEYKPRIESSLLLERLFIILNSLDYIIGIWAIFITIKCLAEAHQFSFWRSLGTTIIGVLVISIPFYFL